MTDLFTIITVLFETKHIFQLATEFLGLTMAAIIKVIFLYRGYNSLKRNIWSLLRHRKHRCPCAAPPLCFRSTVLAGQVESVTPSVLNYLLPSAVAAHHGSAQVKCVRMLDPKHTHTHTPLCKRPHSHKCTSTQKHLPKYSLPKCASLAACLFAHLIIKN